MNKQTASALKSTADRKGRKLCSQCNSGSPVKRSGATSVALRCVNPGSRSAEIVRTLDWGPVPRYEQIA
jgi:hypothetical protein